MRRTNTPGLAYQVMSGNSPDNLAPAADPGTVVASDAQTETVEVWDSTGPSNQPKRFGQVEVDYSGTE